MSVLKTEKMCQICVGFFVILSLFAECSATIYKDGDKAEVICNLKQSGTLSFMFRINSKGEAEGLITAKQTDVKYKADETRYDSRIEGSGNFRLTIKSFEKTTDSAKYTCAAMNNNKLFFGDVTEITGVPDPAQPPKKTTTTPKPVVETTTKMQCSCPKVPELKFNCETWILASLACGCGLFLILLIITILYCNRLRTRRCPHHYKRQPQTRPAGHAKLPTTHF